MEGTRRVAPNSVMPSIHRPFSGAHHHRGPSGGPTRYRKLITVWRDPGRLWQSATASSKLCLGPGSVYFSYHPQAAQSSAK